MKILVCGYGNPFRTDDGVGHVLAPAIAALLKKRGEEAEVRLEHQLLPEMAEDFARYDLLIFADARVPGSSGPDSGGFDMREIAPDPAFEGLNIHSVGPEWVLALAARVGGRISPSLLISVEGESFDFGEELTPRCEERMKAVLAAFEKWFRKTYPKEP